MDHSYQGSSMQFSGVSTVIQEEKKNRKKEKKIEEKRTEVSLLRLYTENSFTGILILCPTKPI